MTKFVETQRVPLFKAEIQLAIPNVVLRPSLEDIQVTKELHILVIYDKTFINALFKNNICKFNLLQELKGREKKIKSHLSS